MMLFFDSYVDTREKRQALASIVAVLVIIYMVATYARLAVNISSLESYDDLFSLLQQDIITQTYIARVILSCLTLPEITNLEFIKSLCSSIHVIDILAILCFIGLAFSTSRKIYRIAFMVWFSSLLISGIVAILGLQAKTLHMALTHTNYIGYIFLVASILVLGMMLFMFLCEINRYRIALRYDAIEIQ